MDVLQLLLIIRYNIDFVGGDIDRNSASATFGFGRIQKYRLRSVSTPHPYVAKLCEDDAD